MSFLNIVWFLFILEAECCSAAASWQRSSESKLRSESSLSFGLFGLTGECPIVVLRFHGSSRRLHALRTDLSSIFSSGNAFDNDHNECTSSTIASGYLESLIVATVWQEIKYRCLVNNADKASRDFASQARSICDACGPPFLDSGWRPSGLQL